MYKEVSNVVVRITSTKTTNYQDGVLINAHYDTIPGTPGAADDGIGVAAMLEIVRTLMLSKQDHKGDQKGDQEGQSHTFDVPVIFLFNGAEEWNHQAAHGFMAHHPWASNVQYILNLEAIGTGGREMVFQCNSGYLAKLYGRIAPYPFASVLAHELFHYFLNRVASTDWSTLLKYGKHPHMRGLDTAYVSNGYVYHTLSDSVANVPSKSLPSCLSSLHICLPYSRLLPCLQTDGTMLNTGENMLYLIRSLTNASQRSKEHFPFHDTNIKQDTNAVFFDLFYLVLISYTGIYVPLIHGSIFVFALFTIHYFIQLQLKQHASSSSTHIANNFTSYVKTLLYIEGKNLAMGIGASLLIGVLALLCFPMRWYEGHIPMMLAMFIPPTLLASLYQRGQSIAKYSLEPIDRQVATLAMWCALGSPLILCNFMSAYVYCLWILSSALCLWIYYTAIQLGIPSLYLIQSHEQKLVHAKEKKVVGDNEDSYVDCLPHTASNQASSSASTPTSATRPHSYILSVEFLYLLCCIPICMILHRTVDSTFIMFIPLMGKSGTVVSSDLLIAGSFAYIIAMPIGNFFANEVNGPLANKTMKRSLYAMGIWYLYVMCFTTSYTDLHPKRLWIQHVERTYPLKYIQEINPKLSLLSETKKVIQINGEDYVQDYGLWVLGFDSQGLVPIDKHILEAVDPQFQSKDDPHGLTLGKLHQASHCEPSNGDCYAAFPYYFPVPDVLRDSVFLPTATQFVVKDVEDLKLTVHKHPVDTRSKKMLVSIEVSGSSHVHLVLRERKHAGQLITRWFLDEESLALPSDQITTEIIESHLKTVDPLRWDGVRYMEVGFGQCSAKKEICQKRIWMEIDTQYFHHDEQLVEVIAYSHYVDELETKEVMKLIEHLPSWSKGAEWTRFPSKLTLTMI